jgi:hypothetical protein
MRVGSADEQVEGKNHEGSADLRFPRRFSKTTAWATANNLPCGKFGLVYFEACFRHAEKAGAVGCGVVAQLVERLVRNEKVRGSTPLGSTNLTAD